MRRILPVFLNLCLLLASVATHAETEIAGVKLADSYTLGNQTLALNGAGIRSKFIVEVYVGALYVAKPTHDVNTILAADGPGSMQMYMLYKHVSAGKLVKAWTEGFAANLSEQELGHLQASIDKFNNMFPSLKEGDVVLMDFTPGKGTEVIVNKESRGVVEGNDFFPALLKIWIGEHPADDDLKEGLLGSE